MHCPHPTPSPRAENSNGASPATVLEGLATQIAQLQVRGGIHFVYLNGHILTYLASRPQSAQTLTVTATTLQLCCNGQLNCEMGSM